MDTYDSDGEERVTVNLNPEIDPAKELSARNAKEQIFSRIRIGLILLFAGPALSTFSIFYSIWKGTEEYTLFYGLSIFGAIYLFQTAQYYFESKNNQDTTSEAVSALRKLLESVVLVIFGIAAVWFLFFYFTPLQDEVTNEPMVNGIPALSEPSSIPDWQEIGTESEVVKLSLPYKTTYEWTMFRQGLENVKPTKALIYTALSDSGNDLYKVTIEWIINDKGERIFTPDLQKEADFLKELYGFENNAILSDKEFQGITMKKFVFKSDNNKLAGVWFEHNNEYYEIIAWPNMPGQAEADLDKVIASIKFTE